MVEEGQTGAGGQGAAAFGPPVIANRAFCVCCAVDFMVRCGQQKKADNCLTGYSTANTSVDPLRVYAVLLASIQGSAEFPQGIPFLRTTAQFVDGRKCGVIDQIVANTTVTDADVANWTKYAFVGGEHTRLQQLKNTTAFRAHQGVTSHTAAIDAMITALSPDECFASFDKLQNEVLPYFRDSVMRGTIRVCKTERRYGDMKELVCPNSSFIKNSTLQLSVVQGSLFEADALEPQAAP